MNNLPIKVRLVSENFSRDKKRGTLVESNIRFEIDGEQHQFNLYYDIDTSIGQQLVFELERILNQHQARINRDKNAKYAKS